MAATIHPYLPAADLVVLANLFQDIEKEQGASDRAVPEASTPGERMAKAVSEQINDKQAIDMLAAANNKGSTDLVPTVFVTWDEKDIPVSINHYIVKPYVRIAQQVVRHPTDVVFLTHILMYFTTNLPSALYLYYNFTYIHGVAHVLYTLWCTGSFTLMMHNHIHNNGVLKERFAWFDLSFPYLLEPLMGHTWDSYYYHHVKHHHVEGNGPEDLSTTIRYQRDELSHFLHYLGRFVFFVWMELPIYFYRKGKYNLAVRTAVCEVGSYAFYVFMATQVDLKPTIFVFLIPFVQLRIGLMIGNWGQHALVDEIEPDSDFRSSITLIDVPSNRFCFNDGYHTAHHLNPLRHWRDQPVHFLANKAAYRSGRALVFHNIDYLMLTVKLLQKDYVHLAKCLVPIGDQMGMTQEEIAAMLKTKTKKFSEEDIERKFAKPTMVGAGTKIGMGKKRSGTAEWKQFRRTFWNLGIAAVPAAGGLWYLMSKVAA